jgi:hypothetical protein
MPNKINLGANICSQKKMAISEDYYGLQWLEGLLLDRFGNPFTLYFAADNKLILMLPNHEGNITFVTDINTFTRTDSDLPYSVWDAVGEGWDSVLNDPLPAPGAEHLPAPLIKANDYGFEIAFDILGLAFWMLNRIEEIGRKDLDVHGRFVASSSHAFKCGYLERPVVDEWFHVLGQVIQRVWPNITLKTHEFNVRISHDVDEPSRYAFATFMQLLRKLAADIVRHKDYSSALMAPIIWLTSRNVLNQFDPYNTFDWIMDLSEQNNLASTFYFICGNNDKHDADYRPNDLRIRRLMQDIHNRGHQIGLHCSYRSFQLAEMISREAKLLKKIAADEGIKQAEWGSRMHYLRWEQPTTLLGLADAGVDYDSTLGYADHVGFRCGTCFEYSGYDPVTKKILPIRIRPLIAMECTVIASRYMNMGTGQAALKKLLQLKSTCAAVKGCFTLLWHNSQLQNSAERALYRSVLTHSCIKNKQ